MENKEFFMKRCIDLAKKGLGSVSPNPMVGCVIVHNKKIIGEGYHKKYGSSHAEVNAINNIKDKDKLKTATLFVNLEPCSHFGKTPPCCNLIIKHKIPHVVIGTKDPYHKVLGNGIQKMKEAGIKVDVGVLTKENNILNKRFFTFQKKKRPYIILKWAQSQDKFIAPKNQIKKFWMTSKESKKEVHKWRAQEDAILVGRITVEKDNPLLTNRLIKGESPIRIIIDKNLKLSNEKEIFNNKAKTIIFNSIKDGEMNSNKFIKINFNKLIDNIIEFLYKQKIQSLIIEGGAKTIQSFINKNTWDEARIFTTKINLHEGVKAPLIKGQLISSSTIEEDKLEIIIK